MLSATIADGKTAASGRRKTAKTQLESAFRWS